MPATKFVDDAIFEQFPDYAVALIKVSGIKAGPSDERSESLLIEAESSVRSTLAQISLDELVEVKAWRAAYASFGVKPRVARVSFEALMRRVDRGLPRIDLLTDIYNAVSVIHRVPIGGENLDRYQGPPKLTFAKGDEIFETRENGEAVLEHPALGEVIWRDDLGVTCRRWNWRQCLRTRLDDETNAGLFILDGLGPDSVIQVQQAAARLVGEFTAIWPDLSAEIVVEHN